MEDERFRGGRVERREASIPWLFDDGTWGERQAIFQFTFWHTSDIMFAEFNMAYDPDTGEVLMKGF